MSGYQSVYSTYPESILAPNIPLLEYVALVQDVPNDITGTRVCCLYGHVSLPIFMYSYTVHMIGKRVKIYDRLARINRPRLVILTFLYISQFWEKK